MTAPASDLPLRSGAFEAQRALARGLTLSLLLAAAGQWLLMARPQTPALGLAAYALAALLFVSTWRAAGGHHLPAGLRPAPAAANPPAFGLWTTSLALCLLVAAHAHRALPNVVNYALALAWLLSLGLFAWSVLREGGQAWPGVGALLSHWRAHRREWLLLAGLAAAALAVRAIALEAHPYAFINDEGEVGVAARQLLSRARSDLFHTGWSAQPMWSFVPTALSVAALGDTAAAVRWVSALQGTLSVLALYGLAREAYGRATAILAAVLLAGMAWHIHFSRLGVNNVVDSLTAAAVFWLLIRALRCGRPGDYLWAGLAAGLTVYTYLGSRLVMLLAVGVLAYSVFVQHPRLAGAGVVESGRAPRQPRHAPYRHALIFLLAMGLASAPMLAYFARHPDIFLARINAESILANGWLGRQAALTGLSPASILLEQVSRSSLIYLAGSAPGSFYNTPQPYLASPIAVFFVFGLGVTLSRAAQPRGLLLLAWWGSVVILGSALTLGPPSSQRLIMSAPAAALLAAIGLREAARLARRAGLLPGRAGMALAMSIACLAAAQGVLFYFGPYRAGHYFEDPANEIPYQAALQAAGLEGRTNLLLLGQPTVYAVFANFAFFAPHVPVQDFNTVEQTALADLPRDAALFFVALPSRVDDLRQVAVWLPGGAWHEVARRYQPDQVLYYAYILPLDQEAQR